MILLFSFLASYVVICVGKILSNKEMEYIELLHVSLSFAIVDRAYVFCLFYMLSLSSKAYAPVFRL